jgi:pimeloyl-ACP methyl ester carboxylesterase
MGAGEEAWPVVDVDVGEVHLHCAIVGPESGELVLLLHGFPECAWSWRHVAWSLARNGYRVAIPDMRGYGQSGRPRGVEAYGVAHLVEDVAGLVRAMGAKRAHVVGHDWGGVVAWWTAMLRPDVIDRLGIVNAPHPVAYLAAMRTRAQFRRGWYVHLFQLPWLPEWLLGLGDYRRMRKTFAKDGIPAEEIEPCIAALRPPGARSAAVAYYRAAIRGQLSGSAPKPRVIERPTLVVWGERDRFLVPSLAEPPPSWVPRVRVLRLPDATHWSHIDAADDVAKAMAAHFRERLAS